MQCELFGGAHNLAIATTTSGKPDAKLPHIILGVIANRFSFITTTYTVTYQGKGERVSFRSSAQWLKR